MRPAAANRVAYTVIGVAFVALMLVIGLWQRVDAACEGTSFDPSDPVTTCQPPLEAEQSLIAPDPVVATPVGVTAR